MILNQAQSKAVNAPNKPLLVLAGAGTGKTRVLIERIIKLINVDKIDHRKILVITFTNRARDEIRERISSKVEEGHMPPNIFTFHAFFHKLLKKDIEKIDERFRNFKVLDESDQRAIVRRLLKNKEIYTEQLRLWDARAAVEAISALKVSTNDLRNKEPIEQIANKARVTKTELLDLYNLYKKELNDNIFVDYDDLEIYAYRALEIPSVQQYWKTWFQAILIDEFQDTSTLQMEIVKKLTDETGNIFCVGDPDQSIYGFRGAKPRVCSEFLEHFKADCIKLEENYRSTQTILDVANAIILKNHTDQKLFKNLKSTKPYTGPKVRCLCFNDEWDEVYFVLDEIMRIMKFNPKVKLKDFAILYRNNIISRPFEIAFNRQNIECEVANSAEFFTRLEIKFIVSFLRLLFFYEESGVGVYIQNIVSELKIGVGEASCHKFCLFMLDNQYNFLEAIEKIEECPGLTPKAKKGLIKLSEYIKSLIGMRDEALSDIIDEIVRITNYESIVHNKQEEGRLEHIKQFGASLMVNLEQKKNRDLVEEISLKTKDVRKTKGDDFLFLSTVHQAKGLEYKYVFVVRMTQTLFPAQKSKTPEEAEEERRLAYVAFTRAKELLYITCSPVHGRTGEIINEPSIFLKEIRILDKKVEYRDLRILGPRRANRFYGR